MPWASVIIPTYQRPDLLRQAVESVLRQDMTDWELVVVSDGASDESRSVIAQFQDDRIRYLESPNMKSGNHVRNFGVKESSGQWIAYLDDDDEWFPQKLSVCRNWIEAKKFYGIVAHQVVRRSVHGDEMVPRRAPDPGEPYPNYTFCRRSMVHGEGLILTSAIMAPADVWRQIPWGTRRCVLHECDWLCRAIAQENIPWHVLLEPLAIWNFDDWRPRLSNRGPGWKAHYAWARYRRNLFTPEAYAACLLTVVASRTVSERDYTGVIRILREAIQNGRPAARDLLAFALIAGMPRTLRQRIRGWLSR